MTPLTVELARPHPRAGAASFTHLARMLVILTTLMAFAPSLHAALHAAQPAAQPVAAQPATAPPAAAGPVPAQPPSLPAATLAAVDDRVDANDLRRDFDEVLRRYPPTLRDVLRVDPTLLTDAAYLASYPALDALVRQHPQIARNPRYFVGNAQAEPADARTQAIGLWRHALESISLLLTFTLVAGALAWLVRTALDHRRWLRASRVQLDVHQKLFDRLATTEDLLTYIQTPAGQRVLQASPVLSEPGPAAVTAPLNRILWSVQIGVVLIAVGIGLQWVGRRVVDEVAQFLGFAGVMGMTIGVGFVLSAGLAYVISRRLGLIAESGDPRRRSHTEPLA